MGKYIKTTFDERLFDADINKACALFNRKIVLAASNETQNYLAKEYDVQTYTNIDVPNPTGIIARYCGRKMLRDDTLEFGEVKILVEVE